MTRIRVGGKPPRYVTPEQAATLRNGWGHGGDDGGPDDASEQPAGPAWRTLADISDDPPPPLLWGLVDPEAQTLAYAAPGAGKGSTGAWLITKAQADGMRVLVYDAERHPREWARRVAGLGGDRGAVAYLDPSDLGPQYAGVPIWDAIDRLATVRRETGSDFVLIDSTSAGLNVDPKRLLADPSVPYLYVEALALLGCPVLSFGHPPKGQPEGEPFGSFGWVAAHRLTLLGVRLSGDEHRLRWQARKANERGHVPGLLLTFGYDAGGRLASAVPADDEQTTREWLLAQLRDGPKTLADLVALEADEAGEYLSDQVAERARSRLYHGLTRLARQGWVVRAGKAGKAGVWGLP